ncbi:MAG: phosphatase PAP2 family protein, partial [Sneathiella sp.]
TWLSVFFCALVPAFLLSGLDESIQSLFYNPASGRWWISKSDIVIRLIFYDGPKIVLVLLGLVLIGAALLQSRLQPFWRFSRRRLLFVILCMALVPASVALGKKLTNVYCPGQLQMYGGVAPSATFASAFLGQSDSRFAKGRCFPAGHASGGFALLGLYFVFKQRRHRLAGLSVGLMSGWWMGGYQIIKGDHFVSHTLVSMAIAWLIAVLLQWLFAKSGYAVAASD